MQRSQGIGVAGCGWIASVHAGALRTLPGARLVACCASGLESAQRFAGEHDVPHPVADVHALCEIPDVDAVIVCTPNSLHHRHVMTVLRAGKHVIVEKPLALTLEEADEIVEVSRDAGLFVGYAEELCFAPKFVRAHELACAGALGEVRHLRQVEKHDGPHTAWFRRPAAAGGGAAMDMLCHSIEWARWMLGKPEATAVWCDMRVWRGGVPGPDEVEEHVVCHLEFAGGRTALLEASWTLKGGMDSRAEIHGTRGVLYADLLQTGTGMSLYRDPAHRIEDAVAPAGWSHPDVDWSHQNGYPQELAHFLDAIVTGREPRESARDGRVVLEILLACYQSAGSGRRVELPFRPAGVARPIDLWRRPLADPGR